MVSHIFYVHPELWGRWSHFDGHIFQRGWFNHQPDDCRGWSVSRLWLSFCLACASLFVSLVPPVLVKCDMLDDHCYKAFIAKFAAKGFSLGCYFFLLVWTQVTLQVWTCVKYDWSSPVRSTLNTGYITGVDMCKVCTEAVQSVALWTRVTLQVWTCVKYVLKQSRSTLKHGLHYRCGHV